jgi:hypothetical protein
MPAPTVAQADTAMLAVSSAPKQSTFFANIAVVPSAQAPVTRATRSLRQIALEARAGIRGKR